MTKGALMFGDRSAAEVLLGSRAIANRVIAAIAATNPVQHGTGSASLAADIRWIVERNLRAVAAVLEGTAEDAVDDELLRASAIRRFDEGSSFSSVASAYHRGVSVLWEELARATADPDVLSEAGTRMLGHLEHITVALAEDYQRSAFALQSVERDARFALFTALVSGADAAGEAHRSGLELADRYGVLVLRLSASDSDVPIDVAARRITRRARVIIEGDGHPDALAVLGPAGGTALIPLTGGDEGVRTALAASLQPAFGEACTAAWVPVPVEGVPEAVQLGEELVSIALREHGSGAFVTLDDLLFEYQASRPGPAHAALSARLAGIGEEAIVTAEAYLRTGGDRRATAAAMNVHPNTVDYRLGRLAALSGMDIGDPRGAALIEAALIARRGESA
ncbi:hypothetical protein GON06_12950 [Microbacterium sp. MAH-37]|nr:hypothetical protein [Microbacterium sp. MAH-37]